MTKVTKSDFIRGFPSSAKASEIVEAGKAKGLKISAAMVYVVRNKSKQRNKPMKTTPQRNDREAVFRRLIIELGIVRANEILNEVNRELGI